MMKICIKWPHLCGFICLIKHLSPVFSRQAITLSFSELTESLHPPPVDPLKEMKIEKDARPQDSRFKTKMRSRCHPSKLFKMFGILKLGIISAQFLNRRKRYMTR